LFNLTRRVCLGFFDYMLFDEGLWTSQQSLAKHKGVAKLFQ